MSSRRAIHETLEHIVRDSALLAFVRNLTTAIDAKDAYTRGHSERVARMAAWLGWELGCDQSQCATLLLAGLLHDVGKIGLRTNVLRKPGKLTADEFAHVQSHVEIGLRMLHGIPPLESILPAVRHHHERWDGQGYPDRLAGEEIPRIARILAVADAFDAMTSDRPYRRALSMDEVKRTLDLGAGVQWDPQVVDAYLGMSGPVDAPPCPLA